MVSVFYSCMLVSVLCTGVARVFPLERVFGNFDVREIRSKECNGVARQRTGWKNDQTTGSRRI